MSTLQSRASGLQSTTQGNSIRNTKLLLRVNNKKTACRELETGRREAYFATLKLDVSDAKSLFTLLDNDNSGEVGAKPWIWYGMVRYGKVWTHLHMCTAWAGRCFHTLELVAESRYDVHTAKSSLRNELISRTDRDWQDSRCHCSSSKTPHLHGVMRARVSGRASSKHLNGDLTIISQTIFQQNNTNSTTHWISPLW